MALRGDDGVKPSCTVVICTHDRPGLLDRCLGAVARLDYPRFEILVVDNAPSDDRACEVAKCWGVRYVVEPAPGLSRARNRGARACNTEVVAYLDDDAVPEPDWLAGLAQEFADPLVMAVAGKILRFAPATMIDRHLPVENGGAGRERRVVSRQTPGWFEMANLGGIGIGANMAFRRSAFDIWPGFDVRLGRGATLYSGEEDYAFFCLVDRGYRIAYAPDAVVRHRYPLMSSEHRVHLSRLWAGTAGYLAFLFFEEPRYRQATLKFLARSLKSAPRSWRYGRTQPLPERGSGWRKVAAGVRGLLLYARSRLARS